MHNTPHIAVSTAAQQQFRSIVGYIYTGQSIASGDILLVEGGRMVRCVAGCRVDGNFGLLVRRGHPLRSSQWTSQWELESETLWFALGDHRFTRAALWKTVGGVIEVIH